MNVNLDEITIRPIRLNDNEQLEKVIRTAMTEFNADPLTTIIGDPKLRTMYQNFQKSNAAYFIVDVSGKIMGGCGVAALDGSDENICELQRMFLAREVRGNGIGKKLLELCVETAKKYNYTKMYLETLSDMHAAIRLYRSSGFVMQPNPAGNTGHSGCNIYMLLDLKKEL